MCGCFGGICSPTPTPICTHSPTPQMTPPSGCEPGPPTAFLQGYMVSFAGAAFDPNTQTATFSYAVTGANNGVPGPLMAGPTFPPLAGFGIEVRGCAIVSAEPTPYILMGDPATGFVGGGGVRWDMPLAPNETRMYRVTVAGQPVVGTVRAGAMANGVIQFAPIAGPNCNCMPQPTFTPGPTWTPPPTFTPFPTFTPPPTPTQPGDCVPGPEVASLPPFLVTFQGAAHDPNAGTTTFTYSLDGVTNASTPAALYLEVKGCMVLSTNPPSSSPFLNPGGFGGVIWTAPPGSVLTGPLSVTVAGDAGIGTVLLTSASNDGMAATALIAGPDCNCPPIPSGSPTPTPVWTQPPTYTPFPTPTPPGDCVPGPTTAELPPVVVVFQGAAYDADTETTKFSYSVASAANTPLLTRLTLEVKGCTVVAADPPTAPPFLAPAGSGWVVWEAPAGSVLGGTFSVTVAGNAGVGSVAVTSEMSDGIAATAQIAGPDCGCIPPPSNCSPGMETAVLNGFHVEFLGSTYDANAGTTAFAYSVSGLGIPPALSHFTLGIEGCDIVAGDPEPYVIGTDPTTGVTGIQWELGLEVDATRVYTVIVAGQAGVGTVDVAVKGGDMFEAGTIAGPDCACVGAGAAPAEGHIVGVVRRAGEPVAGARVYYQEMHPATGTGARGYALTDAQGRYRIEGLGAGMYRLALRAPRCPTKVKATEVVVGQESPVNFYFYAGRRSR